MRFLRFSSLFLLVLTATGCCSVVAKSGDAKILRCPQLIHTRGSKMFRMELPEVSLAQAGIHILQVRDLPAYLKGLFKYNLSMTMPYGAGVDADKTAPWHDAKISIAFRKLDGTEVFKQAFLLGTTSHGFSQGHDSWVVGWNLGAGPYNMDPVPVADESFDIVVDVEQPSRRASDQILISAYAVYLPKP
jgi:hypothetical protein